MAKAKDNRKVNVNTAIEKAETFESIEKAEKAFFKAVESAECSARKKAEIAFSIKAHKLFESKADNLKAYINDICNGTLYGVTYTQFSALANIYEFVWSYDEFINYNSNTASALVAYCRKDVKKVINAHNNGTIMPNMTKEQIRDALTSEFGNKSKTVKKAEKITANSEKDNLKESLAIVGHFIKKNADKNGDVSKAWAEILEYCK